MKSIKGLLRYLLGHCHYCGGLLRNGGGRGRGTPHRGFDGSVGRETVVYACMACEMEFDDE